MKHLRTHKNRNTTEEETKGTETELSYEGNHEEITEKSTTTRKLLQRILQVLV